MLIFLQYYSFIIILLEISLLIVNPEAIDTDMNEGSEWEMPAPDEIATILLDRGEAEEFDVIPDAMGLGMYKAWKEEPLKLADIFYGLYHRA